MKIRLYGDPILRKTAAPIQRITGPLRVFAEEMVKTATELNAEGLAAPQVGLSSSLIVVRINDAYVIMYNPFIFYASAETTSLEEGCLSIPDKTVNVHRPKSIDVGYIDSRGRKQSIHAEGVEAHKIMHEIDHLFGKLIIDYES